MLTNIVEAPRCQALWQTGCKKEACEQSTEKVVGVAGAQHVLPTAVGPAPTQPQLVRKERAAREHLWEKKQGVHLGLVGQGACAWRVARELRLETDGHHEVKKAGRGGSEESPGSLTL